ncbi:MAG: bacteriohemerythrin [Acetobacteraceae bacterium]|nr:bacteriohemerythrin [Acetobacteraceae bacterium]
MALLQWNDRYSVGNPAIDHEHRELIDLINTLHAALRAGGDAGVEAFFGDLYRAISSHFALEEKLMRTHRYAEYDGHKQEHEALLDEIRDMMDEGELADADIARRLDAWFSGHFSGHDARLHHKLGPH